MVKTHPDDCCIVGVIGRAGAGKDELADFISNQCGGQHLSIGDLVRSIADEHNIKKTRQKLISISREYYKKEGDDYFINQIISKIEMGIHELVVISGLRSPSDVDILQERFGDKFLLVAIVVNNPRMRFHNIKSRKDPGDPQTFETFSKQDEEEEKLFNLSAAIKLADIEITNNNSLERFHQTIQHKIIDDELMEFCPQDEI